MIYKILNFDLYVKCINEHEDYNQVALKLGYIIKL